jgi:hypothetical protein
MKTSIPSALGTAALMSAALCCLALATACHGGTAAAGGPDAGLDGGPDGSCGDPDGGPDAGADGGTYVGHGQLVCVFDIDNTLTCSRSAEAVSACKTLGAHLAVNTAQSRVTALANRAGTGYVDWSELGFPTDGAALRMEDGAFIFGMCDTDGSCSEEFGGAPGDCDRCDDCGTDCPASYMGKAYGMSRTAAYYGVENDACLVLFDDLASNTDKVELFGYSAYFHGACTESWDDEGVYESVLGFLTSAKLAGCGE